MIWIVLVVLFLVAVSALIWRGSRRATPNDDSVRSEGILGYTSFGALMDDSDRGIAGPSDEDIEEANSVD